MCGIFRLMKSNVFGILKAVLEVKNSAQESHLRVLNVAVLAWYVGRQCDHSSSYRFFSRCKCVSGFFFFSLLGIVIQEIHWKDYFLSEHKRRVTFMEFGVQKVASVISRSLQSYLQLANPTNVALCADQFETSTSPPRAYRGQFDCASCPRRGQFERCVGRVGNLNQIYLLFWRNTPVSFFGFCRVWRIYKIEFRLCEWITLSKGF